jgi:hypothetical protein
MLDDPPRLTDTIWLLIVDALATVTISGFGCWSMQRNEGSFLEARINRFIERNGDLFRR